MLLFKNRYEVDKNIIHQSLASTVFKGYDLKNKIPVAIKQIKFNPYVFESEKNSLKKLNHPNIIKLIDYFKENNITVDYKAIDVLAKFVNPNGRILGRRKTNLSAKNQRSLANAIKRARFMGLMPYIAK